MTGGAGPSDKAGGAGPGDKAGASGMKLMNNTTQKTGRIDRRASETGFSLLEVIVATALVALVFVAMMEIFSSGLRTEGRADEYATAMQQATRVMNDLYTRTRQAVPAQLEGRFDDGVTWRASVEVLRRPEEPADPSKNLPFERVLLRVEVAWNSHGTEKKVELESLKNVLRESSKS